MIRLWRVLRLWVIIVSGAASACASFIAIAQWLDEAKVSWPAPIAGVLLSLLVGVLIFDRQARHPKTPHTEPGPTADAPSTPQDQTVPEHHEEPRETFVINRPSVSVHTSGESSTTRLMIEDSIDGNRYVSAVWAVMPWGQRRTWLNLDWPANDPRLADRTITPDNPAPDRIFVEWRDDRGFHAEAFRTPHSMSSGT